MVNKIEPVQTWADPKTCQHHSGLVEGYCIDCRSTVLPARPTPVRSKRIGSIPWVGSAGNENIPADHT